MLRPLIPVPAMRRGLRLYPDDQDGPQVFRVDLPEGGRSPVPVVFSSGSQAGRTDTRLLMLGMSLRKRPDARNPRPVGQRRAPRGRYGDRRASAPIRMVRPGLARMGVNRLL